ncbi:hypothetical protein AX16_005284 [Volvariella volvacea WC 439]|nr:hypothetical protein AX16_005284 [Volvariella volvacea WC 439]
MQQVQAALSQWSSIDFETEAASYGMCANALRSFNEWDNHPHAKAMASVPPIRLIRIGDAPKRTDTDTKSRPLDGIRILDLSRVLAGPIASRTLAAHGADVLLVTSPNLPSLPLLDAETSLGKRTTQLDLTSVHDRKKLEDLIRDADVFLQAYRPGGLQSKGFGPEELAKIRPGIVSANLTAWGWDGPWKDRRGFDSLVQTATGLNVAEGEAYAHYQQLHGNSSDPKPRPLPMQALDHAAGYLLASGVNAALCKTIIEGGSWEVQVSLLGVGNWIRSLGRLDPEMAFGHGQPFPPIQIPPHPEVMGLSVPWTRGHGSTLKSASTSGEGEAEVMTSLKHAAILSGTPVREGPDSWAPLVLNAHQAEWLPRD